MINLRTFWKHAGGAVMFTALIGCASVFDPPAIPTNEAKRVNYDHWNPTDIQPCVIARDGTWWPMVDQIRNCRGWMPI